MLLSRSNSHNAAKPRDLDRNLAIRGVRIPKAQLTNRVVTPRPNRTVIEQRERMAPANSRSNDILQSPSDYRPVAFNRGGVSQLARFIPAPVPDGTISTQRGCVISANTYRIIARSHHLD